MDGAHVTPTTSQCMIHFRQHLDKYKNRYNCHSVLLLNRPVLMRSTSKKIYYYGRFRN